MTRAKHRKARPCRSRTRYGRCALTYRHTSPVHKVRIGMCEDGRTPYWFGYCDRPGPQGPAVVGYGPAQELNRRASRGEFLL